ncbi:MAG: alpha/beta fold hydrolase [Pirellulales bacterium]
MSGFPGRQERVRLADGTELAVWIAGEGSPLLMVHGFPLDHRLWQPQALALQDICQVIVPDLRGFGSSSVTSGTVTMEDHADDLAELLERLKISVPVTLCGLSMGGYIAWQFWRRHANRLARLVLCHTRSEADAPEVARGRLMAAEEFERVGLEKLSVEMPRKLLGTESLGGRPELEQTCREWILSQPRAGAAAAQRGMAARPDATPWLPEITVPTLVVAGRTDAITPMAGMRAMADRLPQATWHLCEQAGHLSPLECPDELNATLRAFLVHSS